MIKRLTLALLALAVLLAWASPAAAHGRFAEADARFAQTIAGMELTVVVRASVRVPAPLQVDVVAHDPGRGGPVELAVRSIEDGASSAASVRIEAGRPGMYPAVLHAGRAGPHQLEVRAGGERSVLPFTLLVPRAPLWEVIVYAAFACAAVALIGALVGAALRRGAVAAGSAGTFAVALVVAFTTGALSPWFTPEGAPDPETLTRPNAQPLVEVTPGRPALGAAFRLRVTLFDGSTGGPADDLAEHHAALTHLVVTSDDGRFFRHVHPIRIATGVYEVGLRAEQPGRHRAYAEFERTGAGGQLVSGAFTVDDVDDRGPAGVSAAVPAGAAPVTEPARPVAGRPVRLTFDTGVTALRPWLGMAGHLIVRSQDSGYLGHVHEARSMADATAVRVPDESVARYGPRLEFVFSFPRPGRYLAWIQYVRDYRIVTVPHVIEVAAEGSTR
ncbi:hypothetical protein [Nonomuraea jiangxiensis]|uniref:Secreted protein n=1 Tax=Nonomuraea jiangxiensis TaxID=633440 RepID=A0A1G8QLP0_9ACTN|nr:hypothetical protein [Nonomuraea jiangxiensis]SDJ05586.1 hypothetical protein SAMN05421869_108288 [Nonomuraea jiangxiensis]